MRIAWCTPFGRGSAIGRGSSLIVEELLRLAEVDIWYPHTGEALETSAPRITPLTGGPADTARLATYDFAVYNMGNHPRDHREIFEASRQVPGLVVLHDLVEEAIVGSYAVVTHSEFSAERVRRVFPGLVRYLPLPYALKRTFRIPPRDSLRVPAGRMLAVTVGDVKPDKRIRAVLEALGSHPALAALIFYVVIGSPAADYEPELMRLVTQYGLENTVRFAGYASEESLAAYLTYADFCITLRYPAIGTSSASAIEQLLYAKPLIVSNTGFYEELPDDCVLKVRIDHEAEDLPAALHRLADDPLLRQQMSERARAYAQKTFRADRYAQGIVELGAELLDAKPLFAYTDRVGRELGRMGVSSDMPVVRTVAALSSALFGKRTQ
jgi:glycosyltransferase involved in cell wall biosynthesis